MSHNNNKMISFSSIVSSIIVVIIRKIPRWVAGAGARMDDGDENYNNNTTRNRTEWGKRRDPAKQRKAGHVVFSPPFPAISIIFAALVYNQQPVRWVVVWW